MGELIVYWSSRRASVHVYTLSNMNISGTYKSIATKFYLTHHWGGGKAALSFEPDRLRTLVSMATESSHRVIYVKRCLRLFSAVFIRSFSYLQVTKTCIRARTSSNFSLIGPPTEELAALECLKIPIGL